ncbi:MAG: hypothetical protein CO182_03310 [Lysobacterales bacterium CG_4_9_14_3_um_filter_62_6]|nr:MAG: hypothetical protein CO182_03310 [Xanthomonadales bacterium CG_4_9_14_3_um_filter_62_6]
MQQHMGDAQLVKKAQVCRAARIGAGDDRSGIELGVIPGVGKAVAGGFRVIRHRSATTGNKHCVVFPVGATQIAEQQALRRDFTEKFVHGSSTVLRPP